MPTEASYRQRAEPSELDLTGSAKPAAQDSTYCLLGPPPGGGPGPPRGGPGKADLEFSGKIPALGPVQIWPPRPGGPPPANQALLKGRGGVPRGGLPGRNQLAAPRPKPTYFTDLRYPFY